MDSASFAPGAAVAAASVGAIFGSNLASALTVATTVPLPVMLGGVSVQVNGIAAPLFFVSPGQINFQIPWEVIGQSSVSVTVTANGAASAPMNVALAPVAPGIFTLNSSGGGQGIVTISNTTSFAAPAGSIPGASARPVMKGEYLTIYCNGLGDVTMRPATGAANSLTQLSATLQPVTVTLGGIALPAAFAGLAPGLVGVHQVNVQVPDSVASGNAISLAISIGGTTSNTITIAVQ